MGGRQLILDVKNMKIELIKELVNDDMIPKEYLEYIEEHGVKPSPQEDEVDEGVSTSIKFDENGFILMPPIKPEEPDTSNWKRMTPKRREILLSYKMEMEFYSIKKERYDAVEVSTKSKMDSIREFLARPRIIREEVPVFEYPCGKWHRGLGTNLRKELPWDAVEHHEPVFSEVTGNNWITLEIYDPVWRKEEHERMRVWHDQHRQEFFRAHDTTKQLDLFNPGYRPIDKDILHSFDEEPNPTLAWKYFLSSFEERACIHGSVNINEVCFSLTKEELDEVYSRKNGGK